MATEYPYMVSNNKIQPILNTIETAAKPKKFTNNLLKQLGFASSNDRAIIPLLKRLKFLQDDGTPTDLYDQLRDKTSRFYILGVQVRELYSDIFAINTDIHKASEDETKGAISRVTGKDETSVTRYYATFKALTKIANFTTAPKSKPKPGEESPEKEIPGKPDEQISKEASFHYNVQIHLPATTDISVYNAIFKSLKEHLGV